MKKKWTEWMAAGFVSAMVLLATGGPVWAGGACHSDDGILGVMPLSVTKALPAPTETVTAAMDSTAVSLARLDSTEELAPAVAPTLDQLDLPAVAKTDHDAGALLGQLASTTLSDDALEEVAIVPDIAGACCSR